MQKTVILLILAIILFVFESLLFELFGNWFHPNLLLLLVIFFNLVFGIRYSLIAAIIAGLIKDSFGVHVFGLNIFAFVICAYVTTFIRWWLYNVGLDVLKVLIVFMVSILSVAIHFSFISRTTYLNFSEVFLFVMLPEILSTLLMTTFIFKRLKKCVLRYCAS